MGTLYSNIMYGYLGRGNRSYILRTNVCPHSWHCTDIPIRDTAIVRGGAADAEALRATKTRRSPHIISPQTLKHQPRRRVCASPHHTEGRRRLRKEEPLRIRPAGKAMSGYWMEEDSDKTGCHSEMRRAAAAVERIRNCRDTTVLTTALRGRPNSQIRIVGREGWSMS
ncbi:hypothetical protein CTAM01_09459 [Colletotrichum tamarilloi]|uniref:Uncharacterized protein n=1 Tax=Colletotrichum tamarilloi TaxID=1209934 RepID=A0ABQ9R3G1_9PEZI|nr:uncharacterized protein CTAM01_09459 [Colletotrichum tamarilloi]KAK1493315.1 hypothetical protein CTAM01_09459 [Colletotrichum tamarilloi]